jgi:NAD-dependent deacetylase
MDTHRAVRQLAGWIAEAERGVAFTGAGISTESGVEDFRSPGGLWSRHAPVMFEDFLRDPAERRRFWRIRRKMLPAMLAARPNPGHLALARLEAAGRLQAVITQNIDELHQRAGSRRVVEVHGTAMQVHCLSCDKRWRAEDIHALLEAGQEEFTCDACGGLLKSMTVSFGQDLRPEVWAEAAALAAESDLFLSLGSSLVVYPAAGLPELACRRGARLVIVNRERTPLDGLAALVIHAGIGATMQAVMAEVGSTAESAEPVAGE